MSMTISTLFYEHLHDLNSNNQSSLSNANNQGPASVQK